ncbi:uncharacterized protein [Pyxicephalus adspersus]|uniref:uncharacterized protein n=1 Tax=Pyxicephalus adspersus TaxID=30357 RepID=UPI003B5AAC3B
MDDPQENLTTRSLLKGILATENVRPAVKHQTRRSISRLSVSRKHQDNIPASPSMTLRSQMKARVRQSFGKLALEDMSVTRKSNAKTKRRSVPKGYNNIVEELNNITPQSLLKKIIQNEDEVSIVVSQRSKTAVDYTEQERTLETKRSSLRNVNLSLPDLENTEPLDVFRLSRKKKRMNISQFEKEMNEKLSKNQGNSSNLNENFQDLSSLENPSVKTRSFDDHLDLSMDPQSTYKKALLRKPNKAFLVSLGDFEQGVEDKYHLIKGSQECFIESTVEDKSSISSRGVAELNTELYFPPLLSESNSLSLENMPNNNISNSFISTDKEKHGTVNLSLEAKSNNIRINAQSNAAHTSVQTAEIMERKAKGSETTTNILKSVLLMEDIEPSDANQSIQKHLTMAEDANKIETPQNLHKAMSAVENINDFGSTQEQGTIESVSMVEEPEHSKMNRSQNSDLIVGYASPLKSDQRLSKSLLIDKDGRPNGPFLEMQKSVLVEGNTGTFETNDKRNELIETVRHEPLLNILAEIDENRKIDRQSWKIQNSKLYKENSNLYKTLLNDSSRQGDDSESSQRHNSENLLLTKSALEDYVSSPERQSKFNKHSMIPASIETPTFIRDARQRIPPNKLVAGKKIHKKTYLKSKKDGSAFRSSLVKQLFSLHAKMRLSKEASTEIEAW